MFVCDIASFTNNKQDKRLIASMLMLMGTTFLVLAMTTAPTVLAAPRFIGTPQIVKNPDLSLTGNLRVVGLGSLPTQIFLTTSGATAVLQCVNPDPGGDNPPPVSFWTFARIYNNCPTS